MPIRGNRLLRTLLLFAIILAAYGLPGTIPARAGVSQAMRVASTAYGTLTAIYMTPDQNCANATSANAVTQFPSGTLALCIQEDGALDVGDVVHEYVTDGSGQLVFDNGQTTYAQAYPNGAYLVCAYKNNDPEHTPVTAPWPDDTYTTHVVLNGTDHQVTWQVGSPMATSTAMPPTVTPTPTLQAATVTPALEAATVTPASQPTASGPTPTDVPSTPTPAGRVLADDTFTGQSTIMPLEAGHLALDNAGYELTNTADDRYITTAYPLTVPQLSRFTVAATLTLVSGDASADYGLTMAAGSVSYRVEVDSQGRLRIERAQGNTHTYLLPWTAYPAIHAGLATNRLSADYAGGLLQVSINNQLLAFAQLPGAPSSVQVGLYDEGLRTTTQVRCTHFTLWEGPAIVRADTFSDNRAAWQLGSTFTLGGGALRLAPAKGRYSSFPTADLPVGPFTALTTLHGSGATGATTIGGLDFLDTAADGYIFEITANSQFGLFRWQRGAWQPLAGWRATPILHAGDAANTLYVRYADNLITLGANGVVLATVPTVAPPTVGTVGARTEGATTVTFSRFLLLQPAQGAAQLVPTPATRITGTLLNERFADNRHGWGLSAPTITLSGHALRIAVREKNSDYWSNPAHLALGQAYSVVADMRLSAVADETKPYGLQFQLDSASKTGDFLIFQITPNGYFDLAWLHQGIWQKDVIPYTTSDLVMQGGAANRLRVDVLGGIASLYLNGVHLADARLPFTATGRTVGCLTNTGNDLLVTSVLVTALAPPTAPVVIRPTPHPTAQPPPPAPVLTDPERAAKDRVERSVVRIVVASTFANTLPQNGSGVVVLADRTGEYVLTAHHVISHVNPGDAHRISILTQDGRRLAATGLAILPSTGKLQGIDILDADLALIRLPASAGLQPAILGDSSTVDSPDEVLALGYPDVQGYSSLFPFVQAGSIQNVHAHVNGFAGPVIAHGAGVAEGMSGGPLVLAQSRIVKGSDELGQVIGINVSYARPRTAGTDTIVTNPEVNINYAIPSNEVRRLLVLLLRTLHPGAYALPH